MKSADTAQFQNEKERKPSIGVVYDDPAYTPEQEARNRELLREWAGVAAELLLSPHEVRIK